MNVVKSAQQSAIELRVYVNRARACPSGLQWPGSSEIQFTAYQLVLEEVPISTKSGDVLKKTHRHYLSFGGCSDYGQDTERVSICRVSRLEGGRRECDLRIDTTLKFWSRTQLEMVTDLGSGKVSE